MRVRVWGLGIAVLLGSAACGGGDGGGGVASAGGAGAKGVSAAPSKSLSPEDARLKFAQCMRQNGIDVPDPGGEGPGQTMRLGGKGTDKGRLQAAMKKCQPYLQAGGKMPDLKDPKVRDQYVKFAQCMRKNGVDMPDPKPDGGMAMPAQVGDRAKVEKAAEACKGVRPGAGGR